jgi:hypothetical protein
MQNTRIATPIGMTRRAAKTNASSARLGTISIL